ncbi:WD repeat-containing protein 91 isoform X2 [Centruroides vittatus]|uniref:WD repeat-containing protein 91 isoform X2 n=1 Tax=Centruroides vittatus TaxID=120091 RepID=UPI0035102086
MAAIGFADELVRDYLLYRGFLGALKAFDAELKTDKDRGFRADRIVEHLTSCISSLDLSALREAWSHLDLRIFSRLEHSFLSSAKKLETALLRMYVVTCITSGRQDKLREFFEKMTPELQGQAEWKDWFALLFLKSPEDNPTFQLYFTRQWQDTMLVSLQNFLSVIFQSMMLPTLLSYEEELLRLGSLQEENENLHQKIGTFEKQEGQKQIDSSINNFHETPAPTELMDDFYVIAQEPPAESQSKSIKTLIKNISSGLPASPILGRRHQSQSELRKQATEETIGSFPKLKQRSPSIPSPQPIASTCLTTKKKMQMEQEKKKLQAQTSQETAKFEGLRSTDQTTRRTSLPCAVPEVISEGMSLKGNFLVLSQEQYKDHHSSITHCKFNNSGSVVASADMDGVIKIWNPSPSPQAITTIVSKCSVLALEWATKRERLLLHGNTTGRIRFYDIKERKNVCDISPETNSLLKDQKIMTLVCSPTEAFFACSTSPNTSHSNEKSDSTTNQRGQLLLWDMRTIQFERSLLKESSHTNVNCCAFNHNGQLLIAGTVDGRICMFDLRAGESIATWSAHDGDVFCLQFSPDETACYTMGGDGKFIQWSINKTGDKMAELAIHNGATGPFILPNNPSVHHHPVGKLFTFDSDGSHVLTCGPSGGIIYKDETNGRISASMSLGGHVWPVNTVDWCTGMDCGTCLTGSLNGDIVISTLLPQ